MTAQTPTETADEELTSRESNGIRVSLMWNRGDDKLKVAVYDAATDSAFELPVGDAAPLDVFNLWGCFYVCQVVSGGCSRSR
jgi:hypothetical protein